MRLEDYLQSLHDDDLQTVTDLVSTAMIDLIKTGKHMSFDDFYFKVYSVWTQRIKDNYEQAQRDWEKLERREG